MTPKRALWPWALGALALATAVALSLLTWSFARSSQAVAAAPPARDRLSALTTAPLPKIVTPSQAPEPVAVQPSQAAEPLQAAQLSASAPELPGSDQSRVR